MTLTAIQPPVDIAVGHAPSTGSLDHVVQIFPIDDGTFYVCRIVHGPLPSSGIVQPDVIVISHCTATNAGPRIDWTSTFQPTFGNQGSAQVMGFAVQPTTNNAVIWLQMTTTSDEAWALATVDQTGLLHLNVFEPSTRAVGDNGATATMTFYDTTHVALFAGLSIPLSPWFSLSTRRFAVTTDGAISAEDTSWQSLRRFVNVVTSLQPSHSILPYSIQPYHCWLQEPGIITVFSWTINEYAAHLDDVEITLAAPALVGSAPATATPGPQLIGDMNGGLIGAGGSWLLYGQPFTLSGDALVTHVGYALRDQAGASAMQWVYEVTDASRSQVLAASAPFTFTDTGAVVVQPLTSAISLTEGTKYWLFVRPVDMVSTRAGSHWMGFHLNTTGDVAGAMLKSPGGSLGEDYIGDASTYAGSVNSSIAPLTSYQQNGNSGVNFPGMAVYGSPPEYEFIDRPSGSSLYCVKTSDGFAWAWQNYNQFNQVQPNPGAQTIGHLKRIGPGKYGTEVTVHSNTDYLNNDHFQTLFLSEIFDRTAGRGSFIYDIYSDTHDLIVNAYDGTTPSFTPSDTLSWLPSVGALPSSPDVYYAVVGQQWIAVAYYLPTPGTFMLQLLKYPDGGKITARPRSSSVWFRTSPDLG